MSQLVSHPRDLAPGNVLPESSHFERNLLRCFSHDLKGTNDCENRFVVGGELVEAHPFHEPLRLQHGIQHVSQIVLVRSLAFHIDTTSLKTLSPTCGFNASSMTRSTLTPRRSERWF